MALSSAKYLLLLVGHKQAHDGGPIGDPTFLIESLEILYLSVTTNIPMQVLMPVQVLPRVLKKGRLISFPFFILTNNNQ